MDDLVDRILAQSLPQRDDSYRGCCSLRKATLSPEQRKKRKKELQQRLERAKSKKERDAVYSEMLRL